MALFHRRTAQASQRNKDGQQQVKTRTTVLASATLINKRQIRSATKRQSWQEEAWAMFDQVGELHAAVRWMGNGMSRTRLFIAEVDNDGGGDPSPTETPAPGAVELLDELGFGSVGHGELMRRVAINLDIVGEVFLVRLPRQMDPSMDGPGDQKYRWIAASIDEFSFAAGRSRLKLPEDGTSIDLDPETVTIIRLWTPHPREAWTADSPVRANLPALREVMALSQHITATVESRLAGAGVLAIPKSATLPNPNIQEGANPIHQNAFVDALVQGMVTPITDRDNASAVVPIVVSVDDEAIGKLQHLTFSTELDSQVTNMRKDALERFASGIDLPKEIVMGLGQTNHWNAYEISEQAVTLAIEPTAGVICDALTQQLLWPALRALGEPDPERWVIWYSTSELTQKPDRSQEAQTLYDMGVLSPVTLLRENGFKEDDLPTDDDRRKEFARQLVLINPMLITALAPYVGFAGMEDVFKDALTLGADPGQQGGKPGQSQMSKPVTNISSDPQLGGIGYTPGRRLHDIGPGLAPPQPDRGLSGGHSTTGSAGELEQGSDGEEIPWQLAAIELIALRALELAGKKLLTGGPRGLRGKPQAQQVHSWDLHTVVDQPPDNMDRLLAGAFDLAEPVFGDQPCIRDAIENYCRTLIQTGRPHRREYLISALQHAGCLNDLAA